MAKLTVLQCDRCQKTKTVQTVTITLEEERLQADLCQGCRAEMVKDYKFAKLMRSNRTMKVWEFEDIPRNTL